MAIEPKTTREHIVSLYGHISGAEKRTLIICTKVFTNWVAR